MAEHSSLAKYVVAAAILKEAGRLADSHEKTTSPDADMTKHIGSLDIQSATESFLRCLREAEKIGL